VVRKITGTDEPGVNRIWWDLRLQPYTLPRLKTKPRGKDWVALNEKGERDMFIFDLDIGPGQTPPLVPPGNYTVVLKVNGKEYRQAVAVLKDPNTAGSEADIQKQFVFGMKLFSSINLTLQLIGEMETMRAALLNKKNDKKAQELEDKIYQLEAQLHDVHATGARMDIFRHPPQVLERLLALAKESQIYSADAPPTDQQEEVYTLLYVQLAEVQSKFEMLKKNPELKRIEGK
jgi:hypothetical protein